jgi:hypothetical protein
VRGKGLSAEQVESLRCRVHRLGNVLRGAARLVGEIEEILRGKDAEDEIVLAAKPKRRKRRR